MDLLSDDSQYDSEVDDADDRDDQADADHLNEDCIHVQDIHLQVTSVTSQLNANVNHVQSSSSILTIPNSMKDGLSSV